MMPPRPKLKENRIYCGDCLKWLPKVKAGSVDMVLVDLPYGTTSCKWDSVLDLNRLWPELLRVTKLNAAIVMTANQPFTSSLVMSQPRLFAYGWVWLKPRATNFANAKKQPMRKFEDILVFYRKPPKYNPQGITRIDRDMKNSKSVGGDTVRGDVKESRNKGSLRTGGKEYKQEWTNYPTNVLEYGYDTTKLHPTQKPVALFEYLIKTYTDKEDLVLDPTIGSGTTAVAAKNTGRRFIGFEKDEKFYTDALKRIQA